MTQAQQTVVLNTSRTDYSIKDVLKNHHYSILTVGDLIDILSGFDLDAPIVFSNDNGYTYGAVTGDAIQLSNTDDD